MKEQWMLKNPKADFEHIKQKFNVSGLLAYLLAGRDLKTDEEIEAYLNPTKDSMHSWKLFKDMGKAVRMVKKAIDNGQKICVVGDYDCDGICSVSILVSGLRSLGGFVSYIIPDRIADGYGLNCSMVDKAAESGTDLIITCDNGIAATEAVAYAKELGMDVVVTDHHNVPENNDLKADAIVDPKQEDCAYPYEGICGAVVAAKLMEGLFTEYDFGSFIEKNYDLMALATVVDVMELKDENRFIVKEGLKSLNNSTRIGINALKNATGISGKELGVYHLGFILGPCLNSSGRLETADMAVEMLLSEDENEAAGFAVKLKELNDSRKNMTEQAKVKGVELIENSELKEDNILVLLMPDLHESLAGIVAGRIKEEFNRPAIVFTEAAGDDSILKGSGRSVEEYDIYKGVDAIREMTVKFGGHPMACGLSIRRDMLEDFRKRLNENCEKDLKNMEKKIMIDVNIPMSSFSPAVLEEIKKLEPCGNGNPGPVFADRMTVTGVRRFGKEGQYLTISGRDGRGFAINELKSFEESFYSAYEEYFGRDEAGKLRKNLGDKVVNIIYKPQINEYMGNASMQYILKKYSFPKKEV